MWGFPVSLIAGGVTTSVDITADAFIGNLWDYLGNPSNPVEVTFVVDNADAAGIFVPNDFHPSSTFQFTAINGGRFIGTGGAGQSGGDDNGANGTVGSKGWNAGHAIASNTFNVNIDVDDGYLLGGGGGGGGGSFNDLGANGTPGGGGGGGMGWGDAAGGSAGNPTGTPVAQPGTAGSTTAAGGGGNGGTAGTNNGGTGGDWGFAGSNGQYASPGVPFLGFGTHPGNGGAGGRGGSAFSPTNGAIATLNGVTGETTLRSENRIKGELDGIIWIPDILNSGFHVGISHPARTYGFSFLNTGVLREVNTDSGSFPIERTDSWHDSGAITGSEYWMREVVGTEGGAGWDSAPTPAGTWFQLTGSQVFSMTRSNTGGTAGANFEVRRGDETVAAASGWLAVAVEYEN